MRGNGSRDLAARPPGEERGLEHAAPVPAGKAVPTVHRRPGPSPTPYCIVAKTVAHSPARCRGCTGTAAREMCWAGPRRAGRVPTPRGRADETWALPAAGPAGRDPRSSWEPAGRPPQQALQTDPRAHPWNRPGPRGRDARTATWGPRREVERNPPGPIYDSDHRQLGSSGLVRGARGYAAVCRPPPCGAQRRRVVVCGGTGGSDPG